jgi:arsenate reductase
LTLTGADRAKCLRVDAERTRMSADALTIYHNPSCTTSRKTLAALREAGRAPVVIEYLTTGWTRETLQALLAKMQVGPRHLLRIKETLAKDLGLDRPETSEEQILAAMIEHPILVERPIVSSEKGAAICRPVKTVQVLL